MFQRTMNTEDFQAKVDKIMTAVDAMLGEIRGQEARKPDGGDLLLTEDVLLDGLAGAYRLYKAIIRAGPEAFRAEAGRMEVNRDVAAIVVFQQIRNRKLMPPDGHPRTPFLVGMGNVLARHGREVPM